MKKQNKYQYIKVIQQNYGQGWEDVSEYECNSTGEAKDKLGFQHDLGEYKLLGYPTKVVQRRELA